MNLWLKFAEKNPKAAKWIREGGLFVIVSNLITVLKYFMLQFLPYAFVGLGDKSFGWPGIPVTLFGESFEWNILGYDSAHGGLAYFAAYMLAMIIGECINFPIQKLFVFRSHGNTGKQIAWYTFVLCVIGLKIGKKAGEGLASKATIVGGIILIGIGLEIFIRAKFF